MLELWQAEWCPHSHRVRMRLTELGVDVLLRQVEPDRSERHGLEQATGQRSIPALVDAGTVVTGSDEILAHLGTRFPASPHVRQHREKAAEDAPEWTWPSPDDPV